MSTDFKPYAHLLERARELSFVDAASALLHWDEETNMPRAALDFYERALAMRREVFVRSPETSRFRRDVISACESMPR